MSSPSAAFSPFYVPILNISRSAVRLRPEFALVCDYAGISASQLLTLDDISEGFQNDSDTKWILVDHNKLQGTLGQEYSSRALGVIDHHDEEHAIPHQTGVEPRVVQKAGSCTSLVVRYCRSYWDQLASQSIASGAAHGQGESAINDASFTQGWDAQVAKLAIASIRIDTANLTAPGKVEQIDRDAVEYLEAKIHLSSKYSRTWNRTDFYERITHAKQDIEGLTVQEILMKDYKEWNEHGRKLGISSVVRPLSYLVDKSIREKARHSLEQDITAFCDDRGLSVYAIMTAFKGRKGEFQRQLLLQDNEPGDQTAVAFTRETAKQLNLKDLDLDVAKQLDSDKAIPWRDFWSQGDIKKSRKQVAPLLRQYMSGTKRHG